MPRRRRNHSPEQKTAILREHLIDKIPVSDLCDKHDIKPTVFYRWQKTLFENLPALFEQKKNSRQQSASKKIESLKAKIATKDEVIAEIMADVIAVKKNAGDD